MTCFPVFDCDFENVFETFILFDLHEKSFIFNLVVVVAAATIGPMVW
jgi:hypothetical protein